MDKKDVKALRTKELSQMSVQELKDFVKTAESKGFSISKSKELGKAVNLIKVQEPKGFGSKTVEDAKKSLQTQSSVPTLERLGIPVPEFKKQPTATGTTGSSAMSGGGITGIGSSMKTDTSGIPIYQASSELKAVQAEYDKKKLEADKAANIIDDNPFFSEATRLGRQGKLNEQKARDLGTLQEKITSLKADDLLKYNVSMDRYKLQLDQVKQNMDRLNTYISTGAILNATAQDLAQIGVATGMSQAMLQGIVSRTRADIAAKNAPTMVTELIKNEQTGEVTAVSYNKNNPTQFNSNSLGKISGAKEPTQFAIQSKNRDDVVTFLEANKGGDNRVDPYAYQDARNLYIKYGIGNLQDFDKEFSQYYPAATGDVKLQQYWTPQMQGSSFSDIFNKYKQP